MPKSVMTSVKVTSAAEISPYFAPGSVMVKNLRACRVPSASAASYSRASASDSAVDQDHQRMRKDREALGHHDARRAVDALEAERTATTACATPWLPNQ